MKLLINPFVFLYVKRAVSSFLLLMSLPSRGAWIEIILAFWSDFKDEVAPFAGSANQESLLYLLASNIKYKTAPLYSNI